MKKRKSIHDVAKELQVSATTLSFVLNNKGKEKRISDEVIRKIEDYVIKTGYKPSFIGKSLRTGKTKTIGLIVEDIADPFFSAVASVIEQKAFDSGYKMIIASCNNIPGKIREVVNILDERSVDGFIIAPTIDIEDVILKLKEEKKPFILFDRFLPDIDTFNVVVENENGAYIATEHLYENGYRNIAIITLLSEQIQMVERLNGYLKFIREKGLKEEVFKIEYDLQYKEITKKIARIIQDKPHIDAILFGTNYLTIGGLTALKQLGNERNKIGLVSFDDHFHYDLFTPSITAIDQPVDLLATTIITHLLEMLDDQTNATKKNETIRLPVSLLARESSKR